LSDVQEHDDPSGSATRPEAPRLSPNPDELLHRALAVESVPAAIALATLAGELLYLNARAQEFFAIRVGADLAGHNVADVCEQPQLSALEAVARDGREREFSVTRDCAPPAGAQSQTPVRRHFLCRLSRVAGANGIPTWLCFVATEQQDQSVEEETLYEAQALRIIRSVGGVAAATMRIEDESNWLNNPVQWSTEVFSLLNVKLAGVKPAAGNYVDFIVPEDRPDVMRAMERFLTEGVPFEVLYRLNARDGQAKVLFSRAAFAEVHPATGQRQLWFVNQDVTALFSGNLLPREKAAVLDALAANIEAPLYAVDEEFRYVYTNEFFREAMRQQYGASVVLGEKAYETVHSVARRRTVMSNLRRASQGTRVVEGMAIRSTDAVVRHYECASGREHQSTLNMSHPEPEPAGTGRESTPIEPGVLKDSLGFYVLRANRILTQHCWGDRAFRPLFYSAFALIGSNPGISLVELARHVAADKSRASEMVDLMEQEHLIVRRRLSEDHRRHGLYLTPAGTTRLAAMTSDVAAHEERCGDLFSSAERRQLIELLDRFSQLTG
jgi:DNA-binding MarR family transcriptional regulator/PAS domain-containing protein